MGGSVSKNSANVVLKSVAKISSNLAQKTSLSSDSSQIIYIKDTHGDVIIRGNKMIQKAVLNINALFEAVSSSEAQQNLAIELAQTAKSLTSGLNFGQFSDASNDLDMFVNTSINIVTTILQSCQTAIQQEQAIIVEHTIGSVIIENNLLEQVTDILQTCVESAVSNSKAFQSVVEKLGQDSSATSQGISEWAVVIMLAVFIGIPAIGTVVMGKSVLKYLFPLLIVGGVVMLVVYFVKRQTTIAVKGYSTFIKNSPGCFGVKSTSDTSFDSVEAAGRSCLAEQSCAAYDWMGMNLNASGYGTPISPPLTQFYSSVSPDCRTNLRDDNSQNLRAPTMFAGAGSPPTTPPVDLRTGDCWCDSETSAWFQLDSTSAWIMKDKIVTDAFKKLTVQKSPPEPIQTGSDGEFVVVYSQQSPEKFLVFSFANSAWNFHSTKKGPGYFADSQKPVNASGFRIDTGISWLLYSGIAAIATGAVGLVLTSFNASKDDALARHR